ncbi:MAG: hypothetical protein ACFE9Z_08410 [Promethearchaeota archaeon]
MYNSPEDPNAEYEKTINRLSEQINDLFSKIHFYQAVLAEKELEINQLKDENYRLKAEIQNVSPQLNPPSYPSQDSYTPPPRPDSQVSSPTTSNTDSRTNKRVCPNCGAMGFAIREVDDKLNIISYSPRRMYAKKKVCTKCRYEW